VACGDEPVLPRDALEAGLEVALAELDDPVAARADEVVMMLIRAQAIAELSRPVAEDIDHPLLAEAGKGPVDGGQADGGALCAHPLMELLGRHVVLLLEQLGQDRDALRRGAKAPPA
jgi:hypothetical protein